MVCTENNNQLMSTTSGEQTPLLPVPAQRRSILLAAFAALLYIVDMGMVFSYSAPSSADMLRPGSRFKHITDEEITWIASLPLLTAMVGNAFSGYVSHKLGRKTVLMYLSTTYTLGWIMIAYAHTLAFVYVGRIITGFCAGISVVAVPAYIVEISTVEIRGFLTTGFQLAFSAGVLLSMGLGSVLRWSWLAICGAALVVIAAALMSLMPESPHWLARNSRNVEALKGLKFLKGKYYDAIGEIGEIHQLMEDEPKNGISWKELLDYSLYKPVLISTALMFFQQFSGINLLTSYAVVVLQEIKISLNPFYISTIIAIIMFCTTAISSLLMDRVGRKPLFLTSGIFMTLCLLSLGVYSYRTINNSAAQLVDWDWIPLLSFTVYIAAYSLGFGPIPFVVTPELVPTRVRSLVLAIASVMGSFFGFVIIKVFNYMRNSFGLFGIYYFHCFCVFSGSAFYWFVIPETKGRTIREIQRSLSTFGES